MIKKTFIIFFLLLLLILGAIFFWWPKYQEFNNLRLEIKEKEKELQHKENYFSELKNLSLKLKEYSSELSLVDTALPVEPLVADFLNFLEKEIIRSGLILKNLNLIGISPLKEESAIKKISVSLSVSGSYDAFKNFLSVLQNNSRLIEVESVSFAGQEKEIFSFDLTIRTHSY